MNKLTDFMTKRKKNKRQSLMIDNFNYQQTKEQFEEKNLKRNGTLRRNSLDILDMLNKDYEEQDKIESFSEYNKEKQNMEEPWKISRDMCEPNYLQDQQEDSELSIVNKHIQKFDKSKQTQKTKNVTHDCYKCKNGGNKNDPFMILNCGHIFHIGCLVEIHFDEFTNSGGIIDSRFINNCICMVCDEQMEVEDILHMHNKYTKSTKEQLKYQSEQIDILDKQMSKLKDEMRIQLEYKQRLEDKRNKSKQITITLNNLL